MTPPRVDAHQHFWSLARGDYGWLTPDLVPLWRDFGPDDLAPLLARHAIRASVAVQAAPTVAETLFLLDLADRSSSIAGVVGWTDLEGVHAPAQISRLARRRKLVGLRPMLQDLADERWVLRPALEPALRAMEEENLAFDALVRPNHLPHLHEFVAAHQDLTVVVDHAAKPTTRRRPARFAGFESWAADMTSLARFPNTWCKLSGLVTEAEVGAATDDFAPVVDLLLATFGPRRLLWGSDWPVATIACDYSEWFAICERLLAPLDREDLEAVLGGNATRCYRLASRIPELAHDNSPAGNP